MTLADSVYVLDELGAGRIPDQSRVMRGLKALDRLLLQGNREEELHDAAYTLELMVATGGTPGMFAEARSRAGAMAAAVRRVMDDAP
jgi:hypothetical protein